MKINIGNKYNDRYDSQDLESLYQNYRPGPGPVLERKKNNRYKLIIQLLVSAVIFLVVLALFKLEVPFTGVLKNSIKYTMTSETDFMPALSKIVLLATQMGNLEWPIMAPLDEPPFGEDPLGEKMPVLPVSGNVVRAYGWVADPEEMVQGFHEGIDIAVSVRTEVKSVASGKVIKTGEKTGLGKYLLVQDSSGRLERYANLYQVLVEEGQQVKAGEVIAKTGSEEDGLSHLHFEVIVDGRPINPLDVLDSPNGP